MTKYYTCSTSYSDWIHDLNSDNFKREYIELFQPEDIKKEVIPPPKVVYFDPKELVL